MKRFITPIAALVAFLLMEPHAIPAHAQSAKAQQDFVPGELIVGYKSEQDRNSALSDIQSEKGKLRGPGGGGVQAEEIGETTLKITFDFSGTTRGPNENSPSDLALLQGIAKSLRESDNRVKYAHPNWIMTVDPVAADVAKDAQIALESFPEADETQRAPSNGPNDPLFAIQWNYGPLPGGMNAEGAWRVLQDSPPPRGKPIIVAVLDTGLRYDEADIKDSHHYLNGYDFVSRNNCTRESVGP